MALNSQKGFTLVELILYVALASVIMLATSYSLASVLEGRVKNQTIAEVEQQGAQIMQLMTHTIRNSDNILVPAIGATSTTIVLDVIEVSTDPAVFDLVSGVIRFTQAALSPTPLNNSHVVASNLIFENLSRVGTPGTVRIYFDLAYVNPSNRYEYNFRKSFVGSASLRQP